MDEHTPASLPGTHSSESWRLHKTLSEDSERLLAVWACDGEPASDEPLTDCEVLPHPGLSQFRQLKQKLHLKTNALISHLGTARETLELWE